MEEKKHRGLAIGALQEKIGEKAESAASSGKELAGHAVEALQEKIGDKAENAIGNVMENTRFEAPELLIRPGQGVSQQLPEMELRQWYRVPVEGGKTADGSEYHIYVRRGTTDHLCVFLSGGGIAWNPYTAARPVTGGRVLAWHPNYYWSNLRPFTQFFNIGVGITDNSARRNPFRDWNFVVITYATGDMHLGRNIYHYKDEEGQDQCLYFHGYENFRMSMRISKTLFPEADKLLIAGESAGAFAVPALAEQIHQEFYPSCHDVTLFSDSALLLNKEWKKTAREVWNVREETVRDIKGRNLTLDWYRALYRRRGDQYRYLYACSVRDYLLSAFYNDVHNKTYDTDERMQRLFTRQLRDMVRALQKVTPSFGIFLYDWRRPVLYRGGTIHTMVRQPEFYLHRRGVPSMAKWLADAVEGETQSVGLELLERKKTGRKRRIRRKKPE
ncbi:MAG: pectin acetylesterase [Lachnospiraceae bacterium]|nr:pectin acetylesterase [Lachnospiraceae bacterium]